MYDALILLNGDIPALDIWQDIHYRSLICTDGAAISLQGTALTPDILIGDMDSISQGHRIATAQNLQKRFPSSKILLIEDQNTTDFEKALSFASQNQMKKIICVGALGKFADHSIYNMMLVHRYPQFNQLMLMHAFSKTRQWIFPLRQKTLIYTRLGEIISIFPFPEAKVCSQGLKWELKDVILSQQGHMSARNLTIQDKLTIRCEGTACAFLTSALPPVITYEDT